MRLNIEDAFRCYLLRLITKAVGLYHSRGNSRIGLLDYFELTVVWNMKTILGCIVQVCCDWNVSNHILYSKWHMKYGI
jgi:hypothetical protein